MKQIDLEPRRHWAISAVGMVLLTVFGSVGVALVFSALKQLIDPPLYSSAELYMFAGCFLLIPCYFIWRGMVK